MAQTKIVQSEDQARLSLNERLTTATVLFFGRVYGTRILCATKSRLQSYKFEFSSLRFTVAYLLLLRFRYESVFGIGELKMLIFVYYLREKQVKLFYTHIIQCMDGVVDNTSCANLHQHISCIGIYFVNTLKYWFM